MANYKKKVPVSLSGTHSENAFVWEQARMIRETSRNAVIGLEWDDPTVKAAT